MNIRHEAVCKCGILRHQRNVDFVRIERPQIRQKQWFNQTWENPKVGQECCSLLEISYTLLKLWSGIFCPITSYRNRGNSKNLSHSSAENFSPIKINAWYTLLRVVGDRLAEACVTSKYLETVTWREHLKINQFPLIINQHIQNIPVEPGIGTE